MLTFVLELGAKLGETHSMSQFFNVIVVFLHCEIFRPALQSAVPAADILDPPACLSFRHSGAPLVQAHRVRIAERLIWV